MDRRMARAKSTTARRSLHRRGITLTSDGNRKLNELLSKTDARTISQVVERGLSVLHWLEFDEGAEDVRGQRMRKAVGL